MLGYFQKRKQVNQLSAVIFILLIVFILNLDVFSITRTNTYFTKITDINGIKPNQTIYLSGYPIGRVKSFTILNDYNILMAFEIDANIPIPKDSYSMFAISSLLSSQKLVLLKMGIEDNYLNNKDYLYNSKIGMDINQLIDLFSYYLSQLNKD